MQLEQLIEQEIARKDAEIMNAVQSGGSVPMTELNATQIGALNLMLAKRIGTPGMRNALIRITRAATKELKPAVHYPSRKMFRNLESLAASIGSPIQIQ